MAKVTVRGNPELTAEAAMEVFQKHFAGKYEVCVPKVQVRKNFVVKKTGWTGVYVFLKQEPKKNSTSFVTGAGLTGTKQRILLLPFAGALTFLVLWLFMRPSWNALEDEIKSFIENAPEFK